MFYRSGTPTIFSYANAVNNIIRDAHSGTPEYWLRTNRRTYSYAFLEYINYFALINGVAIYTPHTERITRSTDLNYYFAQLTRAVRNVDNEEWTSFYPLMYSPLQIDAFNLKDICAIHIVSVEGQIQSTFETNIPQWATRCGATEALNVSLVLKLTPKHRVRVYTKGNHILVFTTKGVTDNSDTDYILYRRLWACLPLLRNWPASETSDGIYAPELVELCKAVADPEAINFWNILEATYAANPVIQDLKYQNILSVFNSIQSLRIDGYTREAARFQQEADSYLQQYTQRLEYKRDVERKLLELQQTDCTLETDVIKRLVDKRICYNLDTSRITNGDGLLSYCCNAPLLSYDKDAAKIIYNKQVKGQMPTQLDWLFRLLFIDEKAVLHFDEAIDIKLTRGTIQAKSGCTNLWVDFNDSVPNPHHYYYNCWGSYAPVITRLINGYKLEEMFYQIKAAVGSINFTDYPVVSKFLDLLHAVADGDYNPACFSWRDENCTTLHTFEETLNHFAEKEIEE